MTDTVKVHTDGIAGLSPVGVAVAAGMISGTIAITVSANRSTEQAYIGMGALINTPDAEVIVTSDLKSDAKPTIVSVGIGLGGVNINVMVSLNEANNLAYIGRTPKVDGEDIEAVDGANGRGPNTITAKNVEVLVCSFQL